MQDNKLWSAKTFGLMILASAIVTLSSCTSRSTNPVAAPAAPVPVPELIQRADQLYAQRGDLIQVREALALLRQAQTLEFQNYDAGWKLARANYYLGAHTKDGNERDRAFSDGVTAGAAAVKLQDAKPEGHFWLGANMGGRAQASSLSGLADAEDIRREMKAVIKIDEKFESGSAYMVLGQVDLEMPRFLGGDPGEAVKNLEKGLQLGPDNSLLRLRLAEAYLATGRKDSARKELDALINMKPNPDYLPEHQLAIEGAKNLISTRF
jgi:tetratricopeptide (TPR) repeat protein